MSRGCVRDSVKEQTRSHLAFPREPSSRVTKAIRSATQYLLGLPCVCLKLRRPRGIKFAVRGRLMGWRNMGPANQPPMRRAQPEENQDGEVRPRRFI